MRREIKDRRVVVEDSLRTISMMYIPIDNGDAFDFLVPRLRVSRRDGDIIEKTKAHRPIGRGMMARGSHGHERIVRRAFHDRIDCLAGRPRAAQRGFQRMH